MIIVYETTNFISNPKRQGAQYCLTYNLNDCINFPSMRIRIRSNFGGGSIMALDFFNEPLVEDKYAMVRCTCCSDLVPGVKRHWFKEKERTEYDKPEEYSLWMPCRACSSWLGHLETDSKDVLDGLCIDCFKEETEQ